MSHTSREKTYTSHPLERHITKAQYALSSRFGGKRMGGRGVDGWGWYMGCVKTHHKNSKRQFLLAAGRGLA